MMHLRVVGALAALVGTAGLVSQAAAQYYYPSPPDHASPVYRGAPFLDDEDELDDLPRIYRAPGLYERGASSNPYTGRSDPYDRGYERQPAVRGHERAPVEADNPVFPAYPRRPAESGLPDIRPRADIGPRDGLTIAALPPDYRPEEGTARELPPHLRRQIVEYRTREPAGTIIIDTANTYLYLVLGDGRAVRYGIGVGREGFTWAGRERISRMAEWPDWHPPAEMIERQPYLPRFMAGGVSNPLGARALYLGKTIYRIHGTNQPSTIGKFVSSGCIRMLNEDVEDLYRRVTVGSQVVVLPGKPPVSAAR